MLHDHRTGAAGAAHVTLKSLGDVLVMAALFLAAVLPLLFLLGVADWLWKRGPLGAIDEVAALWVEPILALGSMILPLAWISRRWSYLEIPSLTAPAAGAAVGMGAGLLAAGISYPVRWLGQWTGNDILPSNAVYVQQLFGAPWLLPLLVLVVVAPVTERSCSGNSSWPAS